MYVSQAYVQAADTYQQSDVHYLLVLGVITRRVTPTFGVSPAYLVDLAAALTLIYDSRQGSGFPQDA